MSVEGRIFVVDGNFYLHRIVHTQTFEAEDEALSIARRFLGLVCKDAIAVRAKYVLVAFDGWKIFRYKVFADYKKGRGEGSNVYDHLDFVKKFLGTAGIPVIHLKDVEADDVGCSVAAQNDDVVVGCRDKDAYQYLREGIWLYDSSAKPEPKRIKHTDVKSEFGVPARMCVDFQTLIGDKIDSIPTILPKDEAKDGLLKHGSINKWAAADKKMRAFFQKHKDALVRNRKLVSLKKDLQIEIVPIEWNTKDHLTAGYVKFKDFANPRSKGLFGRK